MARAMSEFQDLCGYVEGLLAKIEELRARVRVSRELRRALHTS